jgi:pentapeptide MXKDX repeat protein
MRKIGLAIAGVAVVLGLSVAVAGCNSSTAGGDKMSGEKMGRDQMAGDKMSGDKMGGDKMNSGNMAGDKMGGEKMNQKPGG